MTNETTIEADPAVPTVRIVRDFDASAGPGVPGLDRSRAGRPVARPEQHRRCRSTPGTAETGGGYRYSAWRDGEELATFFGSFHEVRPNERLVQTFTWEGMPDGVSLDTMTFTDLGDGRTRVTALSVVDSFEGRDAIMSSGMEVGVIEGYAKLDALLAGPERSGPDRRHEAVHADDHRPGRPPASARTRWSARRTGCRPASVRGPAPPIPVRSPATSAPVGRGRPATAMRQDQLREPSPRSITTWALGWWPRSWPGCGRSPDRPSAARHRPRRSGQRSPDRSRRTPTGSPPACAEW